MFERRRHRMGVGVMVGGCRMVVVKRRFGGHVVIKKIRRCG
jgi:hypothetical protein